MINKNSILAIAMVFGITGCATVADLTGNDSATLNMNAAQDYQTIIESAKSQKALDTSSTTYKRVCSFS